MRSHGDFGKPLAIGAPTPPPEIPVKPSRVIHFFDPSNAKMAAQLLELAQKADILLGNLEDAIPGDEKVDAHETAAGQRPLIVSSSLVRAVTTGLQLDDRGGHEGASSSGATTPDPAMNSSSSWRAWSSVYCVGGVFIR